MRSGTNHADRQYTPQSYVPSDLDLFFQKYAPNQVGTRPDLVSIDGGVLTGPDFDFNVGGFSASFFLCFESCAYIIFPESNLDLEYGMGLTYPLKTTLYQVGDNVIGASFNTLCVSPLFYLLVVCHASHFILPHL